MCHFIKSISKARLASSLGFLKGAGPQSNCFVVTNFLLEHKKAGVERRKVGRIGSKRQFEA